MQQHLGLPCKSDRAQGIAPFIATGPFCHTKRAARGDLQSGLSMKFLNWQEQVRIKSVLILKTFARVKSSERSSLPFQEKYSTAVIIQAMGVLLPSSFGLCKSTNKSLGARCTLCVCTQRGGVCVHVCHHVSPALHDEASGSPTSDNISEARAVSPPVLYLLLSVFNTSVYRGAAFQETQRGLAFLSTRWILWVE